jgi:hypothetical protein
VRDHGDQPVVGGPAEEVARARRLLQDVDHAVDDALLRLVALLVADHAELIDREHEAGERVAVALRAAELDAQHVLYLREREQRAVGLGGTGVRFGHAVGGPWEVERSRTAFDRSREAWTGL